MLKNLLTLGALLCALPFSLALVTMALIVRPFMKRPATASLAQGDARKTVLISGGKMTKALQLARSFHQLGHRVILAESAKYWFTGHRFSRAVDRFYALPKPADASYATALLAIVQREGVDLYVPVCSPVSSRYDSLAMPLLLPHCDVMHAGPTVIESLDDKYRFSQIAESLGLAVPRSFRVTCAEDVMQFDFSNERRPYILKSINYDSVRRLDLTHLPAATPQATEAFVRSLPISEANPWIMQEFVTGREYCTHGTFRDGELRVHCCCESSAFQVNYAHVDMPAIESWVKAFGAGLGLTGQASFDFIRAADDDNIYALECNPRTHSAITMYYDDPRLATAYLGREPLAAPVLPPPRNRPTYWTFHELWRLLSQAGSVRAIGTVLATFARGHDAVFDWRDPLPFLMLHHFHIPMLLLADLRERRGWLRIDFNIGKLVQAGGD